MKILCVIDSLGSGGAQRQLVELAKGFKEKKHEVSFLTYHEINFFEPELNSFNIPVHTINENNYLKRILKLRKYIRQFEPDAVLAFLESAVFMATIAGFPIRKWKLVVGERSADPAILKSKRLRIFRWFHLFTDYVVANSHANLELVKKINPFLSQERMKVIYNIVNIPHSDTKLKGSNKVNITIAASYRSIKNLEGLIEAVNLLTDNYKEKLVINWFGNADNEYFGQMEKLIKDRKIQTTVKLHDKTTDIFSKYREADFVGLFSHHEGFPNTICEAMILKKPVIATKVSDIPLFIKENENGFLCESKNVMSIKNALIKAIDSDEKARKIMGVNNQILAKKSFEREKIIQSYLNLLTGN